MPLSNIVCMNGRAARGTTPKRSSYARGQLPDRQALSGAIYRYRRSKRIIIGNENGGPEGFGISHAAASCCKQGPVGPQQGRHHRDQVVLQAAIPCTADARGSVHSPSGSSSTSPPAYFPKPLRCMHRESCLPRLICPRYNCINDTAPRRNPTGIRPSGS